MARYLWSHGDSSFAEPFGSRRFDERPCATVMGSAKMVGGGHHWITEDDMAERPRPDDRPPYRVPTMTEIADTRGTNGLKVVSTFSGCGGSCLGFEMAGFEILWASEFIPEARATYALNHPGVPVDGRDIREVQPAEILNEIGMAAGDLDVFEGSPPCAAFSTAGKREKKWGTESKYSDSSQRSDDLFFEYARLLDGLQPRVFVAENVSGLTKGVARGYFKEIHAALVACGYRVEAKMLDAQWLGVPQARKRVIFQGVRNDLDLAPSWPSPSPWRYSIADALELPAEVRVIHDTSGLFSAGDITDRPSPTITVGVNCVNARHYQVHGDGTITDPETGARIDIGGSAIAKAGHLKPGEQSDRYFNLVRPDANNPSPTVTMKAGSNRGTAGVLHPDGRRKFSLIELRRVCAFPDDFQLTGTYGQRWERLGRAVPPLMMRAVAEAVRGVLCAG